MVDQVLKNEEDNITEKPYILAALSRFGREAADLLETELKESVAGKELSEVQKDRVYYEVTREFFLKRENVF